MSNVGEGQTTARISVKDRLGPLPSGVAALNGRSKRRRGRSAERNHRRGRKNAKPDEDSSKKTARIPVHERLGVLPQQSFEKSDQFFHKRNRQQVWRHEGYQEVQESKEIIPEVQQETVKPPFVPAPAAPVPAPKPFNAEQHRQTWTWVRPSAQTSASNAAAMDVDENASS